MQSLLLSLPLLSFSGLPTAEDTEWIDARALTLEGQAFADTALPFDRLPARARETVREPVWQLGRDSAGMCVRFRSNAGEIRTVEVTMVVRAGKADADYSDTTTYTNQQGTTIFTPSGAGVNFRRRILSARIKCRNLSLN